MRKIVIPREALKRHQETLGKALLDYLRRLAEGKPVTWEVKGKGVKQRDKTISKAGTCVDFWKWVYERFQNEKVCIADPIVILRFAKEYLAKFSALAGRSSKRPTKSQRAVVKVIEKLLDYDAFREGKVLAPCDDRGTIRWVKLPSQEPKKRKARYHANKEIFDAWRGWSLVEYVRLLDLRYCPYCNAETVGLVLRMNPKAETRVAYSALDHILPRGTYPLLALSLYNLVPACTRCNSQFKHEKDDFDIEHWDSSKPFNALHPYAHNTHKWFRFVYRPSGVAELFLDPQTSHREPLSIERRIPLPGKCRTETESFYDNRTEKYLTQYELPGCYYDLYSTEINEILKMEMICTPTFIETMKNTYHGMTDGDFDLIFRRASQNPQEINKHRFAKLIIDLHKQLGYDDLSWGGKRDELIARGKELAGELTKAWEDAWDKRKDAIAEQFRKSSHYVHSQSKSNVS